MKEISSFLAKSGKYITIPPIMEKVDLTVGDIARHILDIIGGKIPPLRVQKLCYYCQVLHLIRYGHPLFPEDFERWTHGPICRELFAMHRGKFAIDSKDIWTPNVPKKFSAKELGTLEMVLCHYGPMDPYDISRLVHEASPWKSVRDGEIIPKELIKEYYTVHDPLKTDIC
jgi:uncharacterized phage-associated protein